MSFLFKSIRRIESRGGDEELDDAAARGQKSKGGMVVLVDNPEYAGKGSSAGLAGSRRSVSKLAFGTGAEDPRAISRDLYCIVLPVKPTKKKPYKTEEDVKAYRQLVINSLVEAGLGVSLFYSIQGDEVFVKVSATDARLLQEADLCELSLRLDADSMRKVATSAADMPARAPIYLEPPFDPHGDFARRSELGLGDDWVPIDPKDVDGYVDFHNDPFKDLHARYNAQWEKHHLQKNGVQIYTTYLDGSILRTADRLRLVQTVMERARHPHPENGTKGAGLNLQKQVIDHHMLAAYPYTPTTTIPPGELGPIELWDAWNRWDKLPWTQPLDHIRDYFGEQVAMYFAFLGHYTRWLFYAGVVGVAVFVHVLVNVDEGTGKANLFDSTRVDYATKQTIPYTEVPELPFYALFVSLWSTLFLEFWKREQARLALHWGTSNFESAEVVRPEFVASHKLPSPVTGKSELYYSPSKLRIKVQLSLVVVCCCVVCVVACIAGIFVLKVAISVDSGLSPEGATYVALVINTVAIQILAFVYKSIAAKLNEWENHRTDTEYTDALIVKTCAFSFCNSYATLFYMAYIRSGLVILGETQACEQDTIVNNTIYYRDACFGNIGTSLLIVFILGIVLNNSLEIGIPAIKGLIKRITNTRITVKPDDKEHIVLRSPAEDAFYLESYEGTFGDLLEMAIQMGYVTLFVAAFPLAPFLAFINNVLEVRVDSFKTCHLSRRPHNVGAQDIGSFQGAFTFLATASVLSNAAVIFFTSRTLIPIPPHVTISPDAFLVWMWVISCASVLAVKFLIDVLTPDVPADVALQLQRQDYLVRKCLAMEPDSEPEETEAEKRADLQAAADAKFVIMDHDPYCSAVLDAVAAAILADSNWDAEAAFKAADKDRSGAISRREFAALLRSVGGVASRVTMGELEMLASAMDVDGDKKITLEEWRHFTKRAQPGA